MLNTEMDENDWVVLRDNIDQGTCIPFLGNGFGVNSLPWGQIFPDSFGCFLTDKYDLARFAQYMSVQYTPAYVKSVIAKKLKALPPPDFTQPNEPHRILASFKTLPLYMTTNYHDHMLLALRREPNRSPHYDFCRWGEHVEANEPGTLSFHPANPLVFHLHGTVGTPGSLVLTEDDYMDFIFNLARSPDIIPQQIRQTMTTSSLLFLGYNLTDWDFRVVLRSVLPLTPKNPDIHHVSVQLTPRGIQAEEDKINMLLKKLGVYLSSKSKVKVFWGTEAEFLKKLTEN